jgi:mRNA interferase MazF
MKRGDIYFANLDPTIGSEIKKKRPVLIVSNNANNKSSTTVTVVPLTSNVTRVYPFEVLLEAFQTGLSKPSKAQCHQIRTISTLRIQSKKVGQIDQEITRRVENALRLHLDL